MFNTPPQTAGVAGPGVSGVVNIPTASTGLTTLTFNTPNAGNNDVSFLALPPAVTTTYNGGGATETTNVTGKGVATGTTLTVNGGPAVNTLTYDAGGCVPTVTPIPGGLSISVPGAGTVDVLNYQSVNIIDVTPLVVTPTAVPISSVEGFNYVNIPVGSFTAPVPTIFAMLPPGAPPVPTLPASAFTASIDWGDPSPDLGAGTITQNAGNPSIYYVTGTHTFPQAATDTVVSTLNSSGGSITYAVPVTLASGTTTIPVTVSFNALNGAPVTFSDTATVTQGPLAVTVFPIVGTEGAPIASAEIATFIDAGGANPATDYSATLTVVNSAGLATLDPRRHDHPARQLGAVHRDRPRSSRCPRRGRTRCWSAITDTSAATPITVTGASHGDDRRRRADGRGPDRHRGQHGHCAPRHHRRRYLRRRQPRRHGRRLHGARSTGATARPNATGTIVAARWRGRVRRRGRRTPMPAFGTYTITTVVTDAGGSVVTLTNTATVTDLALTGAYHELHGPGGPEHRHDRAGHVHRPQHARHRRRPGVDARHLGRRHAGDAGDNRHRGSPAATATDTLFEVLGSHTYTTAGTFTFTLTCTTPGGVATTFTPSTRRGRRPWSTPR